MQTELFLIDYPKYSLSILTNCLHFIFSMLNIIQHKKLFDFKKLLVYHT